MTIAKLFQPELVNFLNDRNNYYVRMYLNEYKIEGNFIYSEVHDDTLDIKLSMEDMLANIDSKFSEEEIKRFWDALQGHVKFNIIKLIEI